MAVAVSVLRPQLQVPLLVIHPRQADTLRHQAVTLRRQADTRPPLEDMGHPLSRDMARRRSQVTVPRSPATALPRLSQDTAHHHPSQAMELRRSPAMVHRHNNHRMELNSQVSRRIDIILANQSLLTALLSMVHSLTPIQ